MRIRILGIDPGLAELGWAVIEDLGTKYNLIASGTIITAHDANATRHNDLARRTNYIALELSVIIWLDLPDAAAIELWEYHGRDITPAAQQVQYVCGAIGEVLRRNCDIPRTLHSTQSVKSIVCGTRSATKREIQNRVRALCGLAPGLRLGEHEADAIAVAIAHSVRGRHALKRAAGGVP